MSDDMTQTEEQAATLPDELVVLKQRARMMGVPFSNNISLDTLRERIQAKMEGTKLDGAVDEPVPAAGPNPLVAGSGAPVKKLTLRQHLINEQMRLIRLRITNMDPKKKDLPGEIFTIANEYLGTVRKYVPYGEFTDGGYHVPYCIYTMLDERKFLNIRTTRRGRDRQESVESSWVKEFALEILPPLTRAEINRLAVTQAAADGQEAA
jgi:hypothetical protein